MMAIRRATPSDAPRVRELVRAAYAKWVPVIGREPRPMTADYARAVVDHLIDLCEDGGRLVAVIEMVPHESWLVIENLAVLPDYQGRGLGDLLLGRADTLARALGSTELRLYTNAAFGENIAFYARRGYAEDRREPLPSGGALVHMKKPVTPSGTR